MNNYTLLYKIASKIQKLLIQTNFKSEQKFVYFETNELEEKSVISKMETTAKKWK
ncbi:hypothetical protein [Aliarcobacter cryaerophilus]|uniref:hypothetical protein n=1 Tax=Aliarcobacter cryaerophilus TaxID=28198 RepID=UPI001651F45B|nr:hypothetical protein [Aliarcobacter cryaerophilus]